MNTNYASLQNSFSHHIKISGNVLLACATYKSLLLGTLGLAYVIQNYSAISLECMKLSFGYIFGSAFELFGFAISLAKLVGNGNFSPYYFVKNETTGDIKDIKLEENISRFRCCYNNDNNKLLVYEYALNSSWTRMFNG
uniref:Protein kinase-like n=1 Tax=Medicago truncatula TaxID=3880 RepID=A2Q475_MEDTR|nr:Protein kinase-like [Medicago truncatula]